MNLVKIRNKFFYISKKVFLATFFLFTIFNNSFTENLEKREFNDNKNGSIVFEFDISGFSFDKDYKIVFYLKNEQNSEIREFKIDVGPNSKKNFLLKVENLLPSTYFLDFYKEDNNLNKKIYFKYYPFNGKFEVLPNKITYGKVTLENFAINNKTKVNFNNGIVGTQINSASNMYFNKGSFSDISEKTNLVICDFLSFIEDFDYNLFPKIEGLGLSQIDYKNEEIKELKNNGKKVVLKITDSLVNKYLNNKTFEESFKVIFEKVNFDGLLFNIKDNEVNDKVASFLSKSVEFFKNLNKNFLFFISFQWNYISNFKNGDFKAKSVGNFISFFKDKVLDYVIIDPVINSFNTKLNYYDDFGNLKNCTIKKNGAAEFYKNLISLIAMNNKKSNFYYIDSDKIIIGLPASELGSKNIYGFKDLYFDKSEIFELFNFLSNKNIDLSGFISYDLGFDKLNNYEFTNSLYSFLSINDKYMDLKVVLDSSPLSNLSEKINKIKVDLISNRGEKYTDYLDFTFLNENNKNANLTFKNILNKDRNYKICIQGVMDPRDARIFEKIETDYFDFSNLNEYRYETYHKMKKATRRDFYNVNLFINNENQSKGVDSKKIFFKERDNDDYYIIPVDLSEGSYNFRKGEVVDFYIKAKGEESYKTNKDYIDARTKFISISLNQKDLELPINSKKINSVFYDVSSNINLVDICDSYNLINLCYFIGDKNGAEGYIKNANNSFFSKLNDSINHLNKKGKKVLLTIKADTFDLTKTENILKFKESLVSFLDKYNFDGINFYFFDSENYKNLKENFTGNVVARLINKIVQDRRLKNPSFISSITFNYNLLNRSLAKPSKNLSNYLIDFINEYNVENIDYLFVHLFENYGRKFLLKGYDLEDHFICNNDCSFSREDGIENFISNAVWALTKGLKNFNFEYKFLPLPSEKVIPLIPASIDSVNNCLQAQNLKIDSLDSIFRKIYKNGGTLRGLGVLDASSDKDFFMGKKIANKLNLQFSDRKFLQNCSNLNGSIKINLASLSNQTDKDDFSSISNVFGEIYQVFPNILKVDKLDYPYNNLFAEFNIPLIKDGDIGGVSYFRNVPISFLLSAKEIDEIFTSKGYIVQDWIDAGRPYQWEIKPTYYVFINGLSNPKKNNLYKSIGPDNYKDSFFDKTLGYSFPQNALKNDQLNLNFSYTDKLSVAEVNPLNFEILSDDQNFICNLYYYQFNEEKRNKYNYVNDNFLENGTYYFPKDDVLKIKPFFSKDFNLKSVLYRDSKIDLNKIYDIRNSFFPVTFYFEKTKVNYDKINAIYYKDIPGESGNRYILDISDSYNVIVFSSLIKKDGKFKLKNGQYIKYDFYNKNKDINDPENPVIDFKYCDGNSYTDINNNIFVRGNDENGFIDLTAPSYFKGNVEKIKKSGRKALLSVGDLSNGLSITNLTEANDFVSSLKEIIDNYGFDGIDLSIEAITVNDSDPLFLANSIKEVVDHYRALSKNFWLTFSVKYDYIFNDLNGFFSSFINGLGGIDYFDYIWPRLFNSNEKDFVKIKYFNNKYYSQTNLFSSSNYNECGLGEYIDKDGKRINRLSLLDFIPKLVWALTTEEGYSLNSNIFGKNIPGNKFLIYVPINEKEINLCSDLQIIKSNYFKNLIFDLDDLDLNFVGIVSYDSEKEYKENFMCSNAVEEIYNISDSKNSGSLNAEILKNDSVKFLNFTVASINDYYDNFSSITSLKLILSIYSKGVILSENVYNLNLNEYGASRSVSFHEGDSYSYKILGLANPEKGIYYSSITNSGLINVNDSNINIDCSFLKNDLFLSALNLTLNNLDQLDLENQIINYKSNNELGNYLYVTDNKLRSKEYYFDLMDKPTVFIYLKNLKIDSISHKNFDITESLINSGLNLNLKNLNMMNEKINIGFYESDGILGIESFTKDIYDAVIFSSLIKNEEGKYLLKGGKYITYSDYIKNKYEDEPERPIIENKNPYTYFSNDNLGFYDLSSPSYMKKRIELMKNRGQKVILSLGGSGVSFKLKDNFDLEVLIKEIKNIVNLYGFDGLNLDLRSPTLYDSDGFLFAKAVKNVVDYYRASGIDFWLTYTGDYVYLQNNLSSEFNADSNFYSDLINYLGIDYFNYFCPKLSDQNLNPIKNDDGKFYLIADINESSDLKSCSLGRIGSSYYQMEKVGLLKFIPIILFALTTEEGNIILNRNYFLIPPEKFIISLPINWRDVKFCSNLQVLSKFNLDNLIYLLNDFYNKYDQTLGLSVSGFLLNKVSNDTFNLIKPSNLLIESDIDFNFSIYVKNKIKDLLGRRDSSFKNLKNKNIKHDFIFEKDEKKDEKSFRSAESLLNSIEFLNAKLYDIEDNLIKSFKINDCKLKLERLNPGNGYRLHIDGIGDPSNGEYRKPMDIEIPYLNDYQSFDINIFHSKSLYFSETDKYELYINSEDQNYKNYDLRFLIDDYSTKNLKLAEDLYFIPSGKNFKIEIDSHPSLSPIIEVKEKQIFVSFKKVNKLDQLSVLYWNLGKNNNADYPRLSDIPSYYNVIIINDAVNKNWNSPSRGKDRIESDLYKDYPLKDFKKDIKDIQARGGKVLFSIGNTIESLNLENRISFTSNKDDIFRGLLYTYSKYGFDGIDINFDLAEINSNFDVNTDYNYFDVNLFTDVLIKLMAIFEKNDSKEVSLSPKLSGLENNKNFFGAEKNPYIIVLNKINAYLKENNREFLFVCPNPYQGDSKIFYKDKYHEISLDSDLNEYLMALFSIFKDKELLIKNSLLDLSDINLVALFPSYVSIVPAFETSDQMKEILDYFRKNKIQIGYSTINSEYEYTYGDKLFYEINQWEQVSLLDKKRDLKYKKIVDLDITIGLDNSVDNYFIRNLIRDIPVKCYLFKVDDSGNDIFIESFDLSIDKKYKVLSNVYLGNNYKLLVTGYAYPSGDDSFYLEPMKETFLIDSTDPLSLNFKFFKSNLPKNKVKLILNSLDVSKSKIKVNFYESDVEKINGYLYLNSPINNYYYFLNDKNLKLGFNFTNFDDYYYLSSDKYITQDSINSTLQIDYYNENISL